jgi:hypothetical protein
LEDSDDSDEPSTSDMELCKLENAAHDLVVNRGGKKPTTTTTQSSGDEDDNTPLATIIGTPHSKHIPLPSGITPSNILDSPRKRAKIVTNPTGVGSV